MSSPLFQFIENYRAFRTVSKLLSASAPASPSFSTASPTLPASSSSVLVAVFASGVGAYDPITSRPSSPTQPKAKSERANMVKMPFNGSSLQKNRLSGEIDGSHFSMKSGVLFYSGAPAEIQSFNICSSSSSTSLLSFKVMSAIASTSQSG